MAPNPDLSLRNLRCIAADGSGKIYGVTAPLADKGYRLILVYDVRQELLEGAAYSAGPGVAHIPASSATPGLQPCEVLHPSPPIAFDVTSLSLSANGQLLAVAGYEDDCAVVAVLDLHSMRPLPAADQDKGSGSGSTKRSTVSLHAVDRELLRNRPGLLLRQMAWHALSPSRHLALLTSDNCWRLYCVDDLSVAALTLHLSLAAAADAGGSYSLRAAAALQPITSFAFGPPVGWGAFTLYWATASGAVYSTCPVAPPGALLPSRLLLQCLADLVEWPQEEGSPEGSPGGAALSPMAHALSWLQAALGSTALNEPAIQPAWRVGVACLEGLCPLVRGPLNSLQQAQGPAPGHAVTSLLACHWLCEAAADGEGAAAAEQAAASYVTALVTGSEGGRLCCHVLTEAQAAGPEPDADSHNCRVHVPAWGPGQPRWLLTSGGAEVAAVRWDCPCAALPLWGDADSPLLLLDHVELGLSPPSPLQQQHEAEEEEEGMGAGSAADQPRLLLLPCGPSDPSSLWAAAPEGVWGLTLSWLPALADRLAGGAAATGVPALDELPEPRLLELDRQPATGQQQYSSFTPLADAFWGSCLLALHPGRGRVALFKSPEDVLGAGAALGAAGAAAAAGGAADQLGGSARQEASREVEDRVAALYGDLLKGPRQMQLPTGGAQGEAGRLSTLLAGTRALTESHIEFGHEAAPRLGHQVGVLQAAAAEQAATAAQLASLLQALASRHAGLQARLAASRKLQDNLVARSSLLIGLHWSLPRPLSEAESQLSAELASAAAAAEQASATWRRSLAKRADKLMAEAKASSAASRGSVQRQAAPSLPPAQLAKVRSLVEAQAGLLAQCLADLDAVEADVRVARNQVASDAAAALQLGSGNNSGSW